MLIADLRWDIGWNEINYDDRAAGIVRTAILRGDHIEAEPLRALRPLADFLFVVLCSS